MMDSDLEGKDEGEVFPIRRIGVCAGEHHSRSNMVLECYSGLNVASEGTDTGSNFTTDKVTNKFGRPEEPNAAEEIRDFATVEVDEYLVLRPEPYSKPYPVNKKDFSSVGLDIANREMQEHLDYSTLEAATEKTNVTYEEGELYDSDVFDFDQNGISHDGDGSQGSLEGGDIMGFMSCEGSHSSHSSSEGLAIDHTLLKEKAMLDSDESCDPWMGGREAQSNVYKSSIETTQEYDSVSRAMNENIQEDVSSAEQYIAGFDDQYNSEVASYENENQNESPDNDEEDSEETSDEGDTEKRMGRIMRRSCSTEESDKEEDSSSSSSSSSSSDEDVTQKRTGGKVKDPFALMGVGGKRPPSSDSSTEESDEEADMPMEKADKDKDRRRYTRGAKVGSSFVLWYRKRPHSSSRSSSSTAEESPPDNEDDKQRTKNTKAPRTPCVFMRKKRQCLSSHSSVTKEPPCAGKCNEQNNSQESEDEDTLKEPEEDSDERADKELVQSECHSRTNFVSKLEISNESDDQNGKSTQFETEMGKDMTPCDLAVKVANESVEGMKTPAYSDLNLLNENGDRHVELQMDEDYLQFSPRNDSLQGIYQDGTEMDDDGLGAF